MKHKKRTKVGVAVALSIFASASGINVLSAAASSAKPKVITLALVAAGDTFNAYNLQVQRFNTSQKAIYLTIRTYSSGDSYNQAIAGQVAGGAAPDIFSLDSGNQTKTYAKAKVLKPLEGLAKTAGISVSAFAPNLIAASTVNGHLYAIPKDYSTTALFYHKSMFKAAGLNPPISWTDLRNDAKALSTGGVYGLGMNPQINYFLAWIQAFGGNFVNANGSIKNFNNANHVKAIQQLLTMFITDKSAATPQMTGAGWDGEMFAKKQVAMVFGGTWIPGGITGADASDVGVVALPTGVTSGAVQYAAGWVVSAKSKNPAVALQVIKFLTSDNELIAAHKAGIILIPPKASALAKLSATGKDALLLIARKTAKQGIPFGLLDTKFVDQYNGMLASLVAGNDASAGAITSALSNLASQLNLH